MLAWDKAAWHYLLPHSLPSSAPAVQLKPEPPPNISAHRILQIFSFRAFSRVCDSRAFTETSEKETSRKKSNSVIPSEGACPSRATPRLPVAPARPEGISTRMAVGQHLPGFWH
jgi:hypothetical protein